jgi:hypothetical protein
MCKSIARLAVENALPSSATIVAKSRSMPTNNIVVQIEKLQAVGERSNVCARHADHSQRIPHYSTSILSTSPSAVPSAIRLLNSSLADNLLGGVFHSVIVSLELTLGLVISVVVRARDFLDGVPATLALAEDLDPAFVGARLVDALVVVNGNAHDEVLLAADVVEAALDTLVGGVIAIGGRRWVGDRVWVHACGADVAVEYRAVQLCEVDTLGGSKAGVGCNVITPNVLFVSS